MTFIALKPPYFDKKISKIAKNNDPLIKDVIYTIERLETNPKNRSRRLSGKLKGKRRVHVRHTKYRIIYTICEECRELDEIRLNNCSSCDELDNLTVILWNFDIKKKIYRQSIPRI